MIYLGADHRGFELKEKIKLFLEKDDVPYEDLGALILDPDDDYPDIAFKVAEAVAKAPSEHKGILFCGSGVGVAVAANKEKGIIAGLFFSKEQAKAATYDDAINIAALPADYLSEGEAQEIIKAFLETKPSQEERHIRRLAKIKEIEEQHC